jgi:hypothetical protein
LVQPLETVLVAMVHLVAMAVLVTMALITHKDLNYGYSRQFTYT